jgi:hypothetical protein
MSDLVRYSMPTDDDIQGAKTLGDSISGKGWRPEVRNTAYVVRLLPSLQGRKPLVAFGRHWCKIVGPQGDKTVPIVCGVPTGQPCFPHDEMARIAEGRNPIDIRRVEDWEARPAYAVCIIDRENEAGGPVIWEFGKQVFDQIQVLRTNAKTQGAADPFDPGDAGYDILVTLKMERGYKKYVLSPAQRNRPLSTDPNQVSAWLRATPDLASKFMVEPYADQQEALGMSTTATGGWVPPRPPGPPVSGTVQQHLRAPDLAGGFAEESDS